MLPVDLWLPKTEKTSPYYIMSYDLDTYNGGGRDKDFGEETSIQDWHILQYHSVFVCLASQKFGYLQIWHVFHKNSSCLHAIISSRLYISSILHNCIHMLQIW
jgi:hypothetical protein